MASFRSKDPADIARFVRGLLARGYRRTPAVHRLQPLAVGTFRIYRERDGGRPTAFYRVAYFEARRGPFSKVPEPLRRQPRGSGMLCIENRRHGKAHSLGLCANCYHRWHYWTHHERRDRVRAKHRRARAKEAA